MKTSNSRVLLSFEPFLFIKNPDVQASEGWAGGEVLLLFMRAAWIKFEELFVDGGLSCGRSLGYRDFSPPPQKILTVELEIFNAVEVDAEIYNKTSTAYLVFLDPVSFQVGWVGRFLALYPITALNC